MDYLGNYTLDIKFGGILVPVLPQMIEELTITQDIDRIVPTFKMRLKDSTGLLGEIIPFDRSSNSVYIRIARSQDLNNLNEFEFVVERRKPTSDKDYEITGILNVDGLFTPFRSRALTGNIKGSLEDIAHTELNVSDTEVSASLSYEKTLLQPDWTNAAFFRYLKYNLIGKNNEACYYCIIKNIRSIKVLTFASIEDLFSAPLKYSFIIGHEPFENFYPVSEYRVYDNSPIITDFAARSQKYGYFDYASGRVIGAAISISDCPSLAESFLVDKDNNVDSVNLRRLGRNNDFTSNFKGKMRNDYFDRLTNLIHMWISTWGMENISPGDIVKIVFSEALSRGSLFIYQHSGYWMVKRVVHILGSSFMTNLLLTRCGVDTDMETTLMEATKVRRND